MARLSLLIFLFLAVTSMQAQSSKSGKKFLALGDSYTIGESVPESERWPIQLADSLRSRGVEVENPHIIATTGWRTDDLRKAMDRDQLNNDYHLVSLLIGVNNQYQGKPSDAYGVEFEGLLKEAIRLAGNRKDHVFVVSIPDYGFTPFGKARQQLITPAINEFNAINEGITRKLGVKYFDITDISRKGLAQPDLVASDDLHPSGKMYSLWVHRIVQGLVTSGQ